MILSALKLQGYSVRRLASIIIAVPKLVQATGRCTLYDCETEVTARVQWQRVGRLAESDAASNAAGAPEDPGGGSGGSRGTAELGLDCRRGRQRRRRRRQVAGPLQRLPRGDAVAGEPARRGCGPGASPAARRLPGRRRPCRHRYRCPRLPRPPPHVMGALSDRHSGVFIFVKQSAGAMRELIASTLPPSRQRQRCRNARSRPVLCCRTGHSNLLCASSIHHGAPTRVHVHHGLFTLTRAKSNRLTPTW